MPLAWRPGPSPRPPWREPRRRAPERYPAARAQMLVPFGLSESQALAYIIAYQGVMYVVITLWGLIGLWKLRGVMDSLAGGVGAHRGRRDPESLAVGDPVDFWRVEAVERSRLLRLAAEMKLPGRAWLQFEIEKNSHGSCIRQTAIFDPIGIPGLLYWYALSPAHELIFNGMLNGIARAIPHQDVGHAIQS